MSVTALMELMLLVCCLPMVWVILTDIMAGRKW